MKNLELELNTLGITILKNTEMIEIEGGSWKVWAAIGGISTFGLLGLSIGAGMAVAYAIN